MPFEQFISPVFIPHTRTFLEPSLVERAAGRGTGFFCPHQLFPELLEKMPFTEVMLETKRSVLFVESLGTDFIFLEEWLQNPEF